MLSQSYSVIGEVVVVFVGVMRPIESCAVRLMPAKVLFSDASRSTRPLRDAMRFSSARDQAEETRRRRNAAARRALELARPNVMLSYMESNSAPMSFISSKLGTASSLMSGYEETGDESQSARNCPDSARQTWLGAWR